MLVVLLEYLCISQLNEYVISAVVNTPHQCDLLTTFFHIAMAYTQSNHPQTTALTHQPSGAGTVELMLSLELW